MAEEIKLPKVLLGFIILGVFILGAAVAYSYLTWQVASTASQAINGIYPMIQDCEYASNAVLDCRLLLNQTQTTQLNNELLTVYPK